MTNAALAPAEQGPTSTVQATQQVQEQQSCSLSTVHDVSQSGDLALQFLAVFQDIAGSLRRLADAHAPAPPDIVGTRYVAQRLCVTPEWVSEMALHKKIPASCIVPGTGKGKVWKFYREKTDRWIESQ
jgi:hypothetical protein